MPRRQVYKAIRLRWLVVARLESAALNPSQIAKCTGFSDKTVSRTLANPQYQEWRDARHQNAISAIDHLISQDAQEMRTSLRELVPAAIRALENGLSSDDETIRLRSAVEILDRDERFSKTAQVNVTHQLIPAADLERAREIARELKPKQIIDLPQLPAAPCDTQPIEVSAANIVHDPPALESTT
jgi:hypothetical protein